MEAIAVIPTPAVNVHFQDPFEEDAITFDYRMQSGPVTRSNTLALMRAVGLEIPSPTSLPRSDSRPTTAAI